MRIPALFLCLIFSSEVNAQTADTLIVKYAESKFDSTFYKRIVRHDPESNMYHVTDTFLTGQIAMDGEYLSLDPKVKEEFWNYHHTHIKHGFFRKWYYNGQLEWEGRFDNGLTEGKVTSWHRDGELHFTGEYHRGMQQGPFAYYDENGRLEYQADFDRGLPVQSRKARYGYVAYLPKNYDGESTKTWPTIIFLHGGSSRGSDLKKVKANGIPDQLERGLNIPFIVIAPQCPIDTRWETDDWFDGFFSEITTRYRVDTTRVYLTGLSLGASGTWYLAMKHPETFAAIAPISGRTLHMQFLMDSACTLAGMPTWIFHGKADEIVDFNETLQITGRLDHCSIPYRLTLFDGYNHWQTQWKVYGGEDLYNWFLECRRRPIH